MMNDQPKTRSTSPLTLSWRRGDGVSLTRPVLHSDGNVTCVLDGIVELGYDVVHPFQESAGMSLELYKLVRHE